MQLRRTSAFVLYVGSYLPLALVLLVQDVNASVAENAVCSPAVWAERGCQLPLHHPALSLGAVAVGVVCLLVTTWTLRATGTLRQIEVAEAKHVPADLINYAMPYIVSFMGLDFASPTKLLGFGVFFIWIFWITYRSGQIVMNPILIVFGWRLYEIKYSFIQSERVRIGRALHHGDLEPVKVYRSGSMQDVLIVRELDGEATGG